MASLIVIGDGPQLVTGLARIARDLISQLRETDLFEEVAQVGLAPRWGRQWSRWPLWSFSEVGNDWGASVVTELLSDAAKQLPPPVIAMTIWDPARCYELRQHPSSVDAWWGYFPIDGVMHGEKLTGPPAAVLPRYDRVLAYSRWGSQVLKATLDQPIQYLPHGLADYWYHGAPDVIPNPLIGCVAANQPRKDFGLFCAALDELRRRGHKVRGWIHTDEPITAAWSIPQLIDDYNLSRRITLTQMLRDTELAGLYRTCTATFGPGRGEGFGYPLAESLACGTPVVHIRAGGGAELLPLSAWRVPPSFQHKEGAYGVVWPLATPIDTANALERAIIWRGQLGDVASAYCRGSVEHLRWKHLWPRWRSWFKRGLEDL